MAQSRFFAVASQIGLGRRGSEPKTRNCLRPVRTASAARLRETAPRVGSIVRGALGSAPLALGAGPRSIGRRARFVIERFAERIGLFALIDLQDLAAQLRARRPGRGPPGRRGIGHCVDLGIGRGIGVGRDFAGPAAIWPRSVALADRLAAAGFVAAGLAAVCFAVADGVASGFRSRAIRLPFQVRIADRGGALLESLARRLLDVGVVGRGDLARRARSQEQRRRSAVGVRLACASRRQPASVAAKSAASRRRGSAVGSEPPGQCRSRARVSFRRRCLGCCCNLTLPA